MTTKKPNIQIHTTEASRENELDIEKHMQAAGHHEAAAKYHRKAGEQIKAGNHAKAAEYTVKAMGHHLLASEAEKEDAKQHALDKPEFV